MKQFLIGQFGEFDEIKQHRDFRKEFYGVKACFMKNETELDKLITCSKKDNFKICVHFPLRSGKWRLRDPQYLSKDD
ncbi:hypothetical protein CLTEP_26770 [Clostridium tepidiprofundi DSM 19306]|uniref:Uncharacterized protein n=1 Tax=Clostridium tepidiprofundi DSM 19306 TaxID=1121338 RepID=A0A151AS37_9CLOT|nr:hypothetical protein [Clostridium tepidiprofundi]KYH30425.1 hypothetical protein CLTEP_26770 [Clostridium tepidiprofundi DSM 19306]